MDESLTLIRSIEYAVWLIVYSTIALGLLRLVFLAIEVRNKYNGATSNGENSNRTLFSDLYEKAEYDILIAKANKVLELRPNSSDAYWYLAQAYYGKREFEKALECFEEASRINPDWDESHIEPYRKRIKHELEN